MFLCVWNTFFQKLNNLSENLVVRPMHCSRSAPLLAVRENSRTAKYGHCYLPLFAQKSLDSRGASDSTRSNVPRIYHSVSESIEQNRFSRSHNNVVSVHALKTLIVVCFKGKKDDLRLVIILMECNCFRFTTDAVITNTNEKSPVKTACARYGKTTTG